MVQSPVVEFLSSFGEVARLDTSLNLVLRCVLVTYFDVRNAQRALTELAGRAEPSVPAPHDCRTILVHLQDMCLSKAELSKTFGECGEVANLALEPAQNTVIVEYYDLRAAHYLLAALGNRAQPWPYSKAASPGSNALTSALASIASGSPAGPGSPMSFTGPPTPMQGQAMTPTNGNARPMQLTALAKAALDAEVNGYGGKSPGADKLGMLGQAKAMDRAGNRPVRTKVTNKEFSKYDIEPEKIQRGLDHRTTVMVRNLTGQHARRDFLAFLEKVGLHERYTFFYMPCKEHRNVHAGFAFVNFQAPKDVHKLFLTVGTNIWRQSTSDPNAKVPAVSYARFQGHDELASHFSSSAVMHEQDPDKRPIFRVGGDSQQQYQQPQQQYGGLSGQQAADIYNSQDTGGCNSSAKKYAANNKLKGDGMLKEALDKGAEEIVALLKMGLKKPQMEAPGLQVQDACTSLPAYVDLSSMKLQDPFGEAGLVNHGAYGLGENHCSEPYYGA
jgi:hypothetical protein